MENTNPQVPNNDLGQNQSQNNASPSIPGQTDNQAPASDISQPDQSSQVPVSPSVSPQETSPQQSSPQEVSGQATSTSSRQASRVDSRQASRVDSRQASRVDSRQASSTGSGQAKWTVLIADDDITLRDMYQTRLETEGYQVLVAADGAETLNIIKAKKPQAVLLDIMMPKLNGLDVLAQMKKDETMKTIPVIILTALIQDLTKVKSLMSGADDYLMKSEIMPGEVIKKVNEVIEKSKGQ